MKYFFGLFCILLSGCFSRISIEDGCGDTMMPTKPTDIQTTIDQVPDVVETTTEAADEAAK